MRLAGIYLALVSIAAGQAFAQSIVSEWFPVHVGDKWVYEHTTRDDTGGGRSHLDVYKWKTEETTIGVWTVPEGTVLERHVQVVEGSPPEGWHVSTSPVYLSPYI